MAVVAVVGAAGGGAGRLVDALIGRRCEPEVVVSAAVTSVEAQWLGQLDQEPMTLVNASTLGRGRDRAASLAALARKLRELRRLNLLVVVLDVETAEEEAASFGAVEAALRLLEGCFGPGLWKHTALAWAGPPPDMNKKSAWQNHWGTTLAKCFPALAASGRHLQCYFVDVDAIAASPADATSDDEHVEELWQLAALAMVLPDFCTAETDLPPAAVLATPVADAIPCPTAVAGPGLSMPLPQAGENVTSENAVLGAVVERGCGWRWGEQDGGEGCRGRITERRADWVIVLWDLGTKNSYRIGHDGDHDLRHVGSDAAASEETELRAVLGKSGARLLPRHLRRTFGYATGVRNSHFDRFDIRDAVCQAVGGFRHGQIVRSRGSGLRAVTIGVKPDDGIPRLWFHVTTNGATGAGLFDRSDDLEAFGGRQKVDEARDEDFGGGRFREPDNEVMLRLADSLQPTFMYHRGVIGSEDCKFDVRDEVCLAVGGFRHGQVLRLQGNDMVVVGVVPGDDGLPQMFFHHDGHQGAGTFPRQDFYQLHGQIQVVGERVLQAAAEEDKGATAAREASLRQLADRVNPTFGYPTGTGLMTRHGLFDISDDMCMEVGGFKHGQVVRQPGDQLAVAVGVRVEDGLPVMFFHVDGNRGAGIYGQYDRVRAGLVAQGTRHLRTYEPNDPAFERELDLGQLLGRMTGRQGREHEPRGGPNDPEEGTLGMLRQLLGGRGGASETPLPQDFVFDFTFWFPTGRTSFSGYERFDIRPEVCRRVGGFEHGQVVREPDGDESLVVGVLPDPTSGIPKLWFHSESAYGAFLFGHYELMRPILTPLRRQQLEPRGPRPSALPVGFVDSLHLSFRFFDGLNAADTALYDIRDDVCLAVGGFTHGQVIRKDGREMVVVGVRVEGGGRPALWYKPRDARGAGTLQWISEDAQLAGEMLQAVGSEVLGEVPEVPDFSPLQRNNTVISEPEAEDGF